MKKQDLNKFKPTGTDAKNYVILGVCPETRDAFGNTKRDEWQKLAVPAEYFTQDNYHRTLATFEPSLARMQGDEKGNVSVKSLVAEISRPERAGQFTIIHMPDFVKNMCEITETNKGSKGSKQAKGDETLKDMDSVPMPTIENTTENAE